MKYFQISLLFLLGGCHHGMEGVDYLGLAEHYAVDAPHSKCCPCCTLNPIE